MQIACLENNNINFDFTTDIKKTKKDLEKYAIKLTNQY